MATLLILLSVFASVLLILVVLIQPGKAEMISGMGGIGGQAMNLFGVRAGRNFLQNLTIGLTAAIMIIALLVNKVFLTEAGTGERQATVEGAEVPVNAPPTGSPAPAQQPTQQQAQPAQPAPQGN